MAPRGAVVLTDHPWPDVMIERELIESAGYRLIAGPVTAGSAEHVEQLIAQHDPLDHHLLGAGIRTRYCQSRTPAHRRAHGRWSGQY